MACPHCGSERTVAHGNGRRKCISSEHPSAAPRTYNLDRELTQAEYEEAQSARRGWAPEHGIEAPLPIGQKLKGTSTLTDMRTGEPVMQWIKSNEDDEAMQAALEAAFSAMGEQLPRMVPRPAPAHTDARLLNCYVISDHHLGMLAWGEEAGEDWDIKIAEQLLLDWFGAAIERSPAAKTAVFAQLGDFLHWDGMDAVTPAHKHLLDADTRFQKLIRVAIRVIRRVIDLLLDKHEKVVVLMAEGNHDPASSIAMREWLRALYEDEPRIEVITSPDPYYCIEHGKTALFFHHGHLHKMKDIDTVFAAKFREVFGRTEHAYAHMGHLHHIDVKETNLMVIEQHRTLAAKDAYASRGGWMSGRDAQCISYDTEYGEVSRVRLNAAMFKDRG